MKERHSLIVVLLAVAGSACPARAETWRSDNGNGTYSNPLFYEEFEDPDVIRVGEDYYLAGTTMHMNPAVQIMHSKDLVNWELVGYCMDRLDLGPAFRLNRGASRKQIPISISISRTVRVFLSR